MGLFDKIFKKNNGNTFPGQNVEEKVIQPEPLNENVDPNNTLIAPMTPEDSIPLKPGQNLAVGTEEPTFGINAPQFNSVEDIDKQFPVNDEAAPSETPSIENFKPEVPTSVAPVAPVVDTPVVPTAEAPVTPAVDAPVQTEPVAPVAQVSETPVAPVEEKPAETQAPLMFGDPVTEQKNVTEPVQAAPATPSPIRLVVPSEPRPIAPDSNQNVAPVQPTPIHLVGQEHQVQPAPDAPIFGDPTPIQNGEVESLNASPVVQQPEEPLHMPGVDPTDFNGERLDGGTSPQLK